MLRGVLRIAVALFVAPEPAAPPDATEAPAAEAKRLFAEGSSKYELGDCQGAIELWEQAYELLPLGLRAQLQVPLANAHVCAYESDEDPEHLRRAQVLFGDYLAALDAVDQQTRAEVEGLLKQVSDTLAELEAEAERRKQELAEREAIAREEAAKAETIQQMQDLDPWTDEQRRRFRIFNGVGGSLIGLGAAGLGVMATGLVLGENVDVRGSHLTVHDPYSEYARLRETGRDYNVMAAVSGAIGGALLVSGVSMIVVAAVERRRAKLELERGKSARIRPTGTGLELQF
jgi:hypothetical protein